MRTLTPTSALLTLRSRPQKVNGNVGNRMKMKRNHGVRGRVNLSPRRKPMERLAKKATGRPVKERRRKSQNYSWPLNGTKRDLTPLDGGYLRSWMVFGAYFPFFFASIPLCIDAWYRTYFDGKAFYSRLGNPFTPPDRFFKSSRTAPHVV